MMLHITHKVRLAMYRVLESFRVIVRLFSDEVVGETKSRFTYKVVRRTSCCISCARAKQKITREVTHKNLLCFKPFYSLKYKVL